MNAFPRRLRDLLDALVIRIWWSIEPLHTPRVLGLVAPCSLEGCHEFLDMAGRVLVAMTKILDLLDCEADDAAQALERSQTGMLQEWKAYFDLKKITAFRPRSSTTNLTNYRRRSMLVVRPSRARTTMASSVSGSKDSKDVFDSAMMVA